MFSLRPTSHFGQNTPAPKQLNESESRMTNVIDSNLNNNGIKNTVDLTWNDNLSKTGIKSHLGTEQRLRRFGSDLTNTAQRLHSITLDTDSTMKFDTIPQKLSFQSAKPKHKYKKQSIKKNHNIRNNRDTNTDKNKHRNNDNSIVTEPVFMINMLRTVNPLLPTNFNVMQPNLLNTLKSNKTQSRFDNDNLLAVTQFEMNNDTDLLCEPEIGPNTEKYGSWKPSVLKEDKLNLEIAFEMFASYRTFVPSRPLINIDFSDLNEPTPRKFDLIPISKNIDLINIINNEYDIEKDIKSEMNNKNKNKNENKNKNGMIEMHFEYEIDTEMNDSFLDINTFCQKNGIDTNLNEIDNLVNNHCDLPINDESNELDSPFPTVFWLEAEIIE